MNSSLPKLLVISVLIFGCNSSFAKVTDTHSVSNPFQVAQTDPNDIVSENCPKITAKSNPYIIHTQADVDSFANKHSKCISVPYLIISGKDISNLNGLKNIQNITGGQDPLTGITGVYIGPVSNGKGSYSNDALKQLTGLDNLQNVNGSISISGNNKLESINALNNVAHVTGSIHIDYNHNLANVSIFSNKLNDVSGGIALVDNPKITDFSKSFRYLKTIDDKTDGLTLDSSYMPWFGSLTKVAGGLYLSNLPYTDFYALGFGQLNYVGRQIGIYENYELVSLKGLEHIELLGKTPRDDDKELLYFNDNPVLIDCFDLSQVYDSKQAAKFTFDNKTPATCKTTLEGI